MGKSKLFSFEGRVDLVDIAIIDMFLKRHMGVHVKNRSDLLRTITEFVSVLATGRDPSLATEFAGAKEAEMYLRSEGLGTVKGTKRREQLERKMAEIGTSAREMGTGEDQRVIDTIEAIKVFKIQGATKETIERAIKSSAEQLGVSESVIREKLDNKPWEQEQSVNSGAVVGKHPNLRD